MRRFVRYVPAAIIVALLLVVYGPAFLAHMDKAQDPFFFNDDARIQIFPFFRYSNPEVFQNDYLGDYALALLPSGFRAMYWLAAHTIDAEAWSRVVTYPLTAITAIALAVAAFRIGRYPAAFLAAAICLGSNLYLERLTGGLPRSFGYPLAACALLALIRGRWRWLAAVTVVGAAFYPTIGLLSGMLLTLWFLVVRDVDRGDAADFSLKKRLIILAGVAFASALLLLPPMIGSVEYGPRITAEHIATYPEAGAGGVASAEDRPPYSAVLPTVSGIMERAIVNAGQPLLPSLREIMPRTEMIVVDVLLLVACFGLIVLGAKRDDVRRMAMFPIAAVIGHSLARGFAPYLYSPSRFVLYPIPVFFAVMLGGGLVGALDRLLPSKLNERGRAAVAWVVVMLFMALLGGRGQPTAGLTFGLGTEQQEISAAVAALPKDALVAGWPDDPMNNLPLVARRRALVTGEMHIPFHKTYLDEIRKRMQAMIPAYFARSAGPLVTLRDDFGVTHLLVNYDHLNGRPPRYAQPYGTWVARAVSAGRGPYYAQTHAAEIAVWRKGRFALIALDRVPVAEPPPPPPPSTPTTMPSLPSVNP